MRRAFTPAVVGVSVALIAALVVVAVPADGAPNGGGPGDPLLLSRVNQAGPMTVLKSNGGFRILAKNPKRPPLMVYTPESMPPFDVSSTAKVEHLNADLLDGLDSSAFSRVGHAHDGRYYTEAESDARFVRQSDLVMPVAAYSGGGDAVHVGSADAIVETVSLTAPAAGVVIVSSTTAVEEPTAYDLVACSITTGTEIDHTHRQDWESPGRPGYLWQMTGTRGFPVAAGAVFTANLVCRQSGNSPTTSFTDAVMTAIFIPNP